MNDELPPNGLYTLAAATRPHIDWDQLYDTAIATGREHCVTVDEERVAACDELLARCIEELVRLSRCAALASASTPANERRRSIEVSAAGLIRLLERALAAHRRDRTQETSSVREDVTRSAAINAADLNEHSTADPWPLPTAIDQAAHDIARALVANTHERAELPRHIIGAASELLVIYAAVATL